MYGTIALGSISGMLTLKSRFQHGSSKPSIDILPLWYVHLANNKVVHTKGKREQNKSIYPLTQEAVTVLSNSWRPRRLGQKAASRVRLFLNPSSSFLFIFSSPPHPSLCPLPSRHDSKSCSSSRALVVRCQRFRSVNSTL